jgi:predicted  nucleic acid-binding Zn-ribbon protein
VLNDFLKEQTKELEYHSQTLKDQEETIRSLEAHIDSLKEQIEDAQSSMVTLMEAQVSLDNYLEKAKDQVLPILSKVNRKRKGAIDCGIEEGQSSSRKPLVTQFREVVKEIMKNTT